MWRESLQCVSVRLGFLCNANHFTQTVFFLFQYNIWNTFSYLSWNDMQIIYLTSEKVHLSMSEVKNVKRPLWMKYGSWIRSFWAPIPPLHYASLCLNSTPHKNMSLLIQSWNFLLICSHQDYFPHLNLLWKVFVCFFFNQVCTNEKISPCTNI